MWFFVFVFFKQKTAYEMRISDWSSDVCSSDLFQRYVGVDSWIAGEAQASLPALTAIVRRGMTAAHRKAAADRTARFAEDHATTLAQAHKAVRLGWDARSGEHTSELQSLMRISYAVFCLKKKNKRSQCTARLQ